MLDETVTWKGLFGALVIFFFIFVIVVFVLLYFLAKFFLKRVVGDFQKQVRCDLTKNLKSDFDKAKKDLSSSTAEIFKKGEAEDTQKKIEELMKRYGLN